MTKKNVASLEEIRHSSEHILTYCLSQLFRGSKNIVMAHGPATEEGFYTDFANDGEGEIGEKDFEKIEREMQKIIEADWEFKSYEVSLSEAVDFWANNRFKKETIATIAVQREAQSSGSPEVTFYVLATKEKMEQLEEKWWMDVTFEEMLKRGYFVDLCMGPHVKKTSEIGAVKLLSMSGAYWQNNEQNEMLTRITGTAFATREELDNYLTMMEEAKKRDHKKLGRELDLFSFDCDCPGAVFWHEKGMVIWNELEKLGKKLRRDHGFIQIKTPMMAKNGLWVTSGHWDHYKDDMFQFRRSEDDVDGGCDDNNAIYCLKPMDCPFNIKIYQTRQRSYRELPVRYTEIGQVFRNEKSGELNGLFRVREITQDDSHILCREDQVSAEIANLLEAVKKYYEKLGLTPSYFLSTMPDDHLGEEATWNRAESDLMSALETEGIKYEVKEKDGAFYGPKIDVDIADSLGRKWQVATIQLDFQLPGRFGCEYVDAQNQKQVPVMIHAAIFGSFERMIGVLIEHHSGRLPWWLSPVQVAVLSVTDCCSEKAQEVGEKLRALGIRVEVDNDNERLGAKIRAVQAQKIPAHVVIGNKEVAGERMKIEINGEGLLDEDGKKLVERAEKLINEKTATV
ncbi:threonine--tRNA ligase [Microgenomates group bacterium]|nr:threonine--tRNA ligase [Microgenomates group bacterium]